MSIDVPKNKKDLHSLGLQSINDGIFSVRRRELCLQIWHEGYHAEIQVVCFVILIVSYAIYLALLLNLSNDKISVFTIVICVVSVLLIIFLALVEDHNKPLTKAEVKESKKKVI